LISAVAKAKEGSVSFYGASGSSSSSASGQKRTLTPLLPLADADDAPPSMARRLRLPLRVLATWLRRS
jgi:hypothetical protein